MSSYAGKTALITGASSGIGEAFARVLAERGMHVILVARTEQRLRALAEALTQTCGVRAEVIPSDLSQEYAAQAILHEVQARDLKVDLLINNAGFGTYGHFTDLNSQHDHAAVMVNVASIVDLTHAFLPLMVQRGEGAIINVASLSAFIPLPYMAVYGACKAFIFSFSEALAQEYRGHGVRVIALCPGSVQTHFFDALGGKDPAVAAGVRVLTPEQAVQVALDGLERRHSYVIAGKAHRLIPLIVRLLPRQAYLRLAEKMLRSALPPNKASTEVEG